MSDESELISFMEPWTKIGLLTRHMADVKPVTVELFDGEWVCAICRQPARCLPDMTPAIEAGARVAHTQAIIDHLATKPCGAR